MKLTAILTVVGLAITAAANPVPVPEAEPAQLEARNCPAGVILESCLRQCKTTKCRNCCYVGCATC
ncbi:hypothetical protein N657DRAFT_644744 [Parathielavia appendiculata]|uniref:Uncharacterized protein n=1 Tax=Parathielavia appendiculata TaxID=2587402 RepID=A0AAN6U149_9PEZI|nr:hypothetical protein N657DRAFT_644744 [Parathielavia appendiculata]